MVNVVYSERGLYMTVNVSEAKAQLSSLLDRVYHGETVTIAKNNLPIADLVKHQPRGKRSAWPSCRSTTGTRSTACWWSRARPTISPW